MSLVAEVSAQDIERLLAPIDPETPAGLFDMEDDIYQAVDQEMVKLGGLHQATIDWPYIEEASREYLSQRCKHLRIVAHLSAAWLRSGCWARWGFTAGLLAGVLDRYWESAHPKPGPKGLLGKRKLVVLVLNRLLEALPRLDRFTYGPAQAAAARQAMECLQRQTDKAQLEPSLLDALQQQLSKQLECTGGNVESAPATVAAPLPTPAPLGATFAAPKASLSLGNERETRRALLNMADYINQQDHYDPTGYQLRRFGLWAPIKAAPMSRQDHRTELMAVPTDIAGSYEDAIASQATDLALLLRIEKSVAASPYWIRGSFLASVVAKRLAMGEVAEAIRAATVRFVQRLPALQRLCFSDGTAFVDEPCLAWLKGAQGQVDRGAPAHEFGTLREELANQLEAGGIEPVLLRLQALQADFGAPRERCHSTLIAADLLAARGVSWLAQDLCSSVALTMQQTTADAWEPDVFQRLQQYGAHAELTDQNKDWKPS
ncbi:type VI secretion system protein TssA [Pseudomonas putida]|uniref:Type VI secretion system protein TssA n=1 Tax=Pseudomonas putida TaxID=303 RepID=A0A6I6XHS4_PSEPU|nr:type VI secretion system protein TssA [Pseudomonas putida]QHG65094.1 type VI secretion system protein TssA [Pseudomonas putida]